LVENLTSQLKLPAGHVRVETWMIGSDRIGVTRHWFNFNEN